MQWYRPKLLNGTAVPLLATSSAWRASLVFFQVCQAAGFMFAVPSHMQWSLKVLGSTIQSSWQHKIMLIHLNIAGTDLPKVGELNQL